MEVRGAQRFSLDTNSCSCRLELPWNPPHAQIPNPQISRTQIKPPHSSPGCSPSLRTPGRSSVVLTRILEPPGLNKVPEVDRGPEAGK